MLVHEGSEFEVTTWFHILGQALSKSCNSIAFDIKGYQRNATLNCT